MKIGKIHTLWIIILSAIYTVNCCGKAAFMHFINKITREWMTNNLKQWTRRILNLIKVQYVIVNPHNVKINPAVPTIIMCNHSSLYDIPLSFCAFPDSPIRMLAKKELSRIPVMGRGMKAGEFLFVDRGNRQEAIKDLQKIQKLLESGVVLWIAPEGTRSKDGTLGAFKKGGFITAINTKATIIPICIRGANEILPARTLSFNLNQKAEVHIGEPIDASLYSLKERNELLEKTRNVMEALL